MYFKKFPYPPNFEFAPVAPNRKFKTGLGSYRFNVTGNGGDIFHFTVTGKGWKASDSMVELEFPGERETLKGERTHLVFTKDGGFEWKTREGATVLASAPGEFFGARSGE